MNKEIALYIAVSLDGFIARKNGAVDFLDPYNGDGEDYGYNAFYKSIDSIIMGNTTYREFGHTEEFYELYKDKPIFVFTGTPREKERNVTFVNEDILSFTGKLEGRVWMLGGAAIFNAFLKYDLIDEFIITVIPTLLGEGIPLFQETGLERFLKLEEVKSYGNGIAQVRYKKSETL